MIFGSVCSGIEATSVAWSPLGWRAAWLSEIEPFPSAVLAQRHPTVPNLGDMTCFKEWPDAVIDLLVGGTPCQSFSVAGLRKGLADPRGNLMLTYLAIAERFAPRWLVWENVPGVLSSNGGRDFGTLLGGLAELGYGFAYRVLDAQYIRVESHARPVPQRRRRVFVVGYFGDWRPPAAVLFERESLRGHSPPSRKAGQGVAPTLAARTRGGGGLGTDFDCDGGLIPGVASALTTSNQRIDAESETLLVAHTLRAKGFDASEDGTGRGTPLVPVVQPYTLAIRGRAGEHQLEFRQDGTANAVLTPNGGRAGIGVGAIAFDTTQITSRGNYSNPKPGDPCHPLAEGAHAPAIAFDCKASGQNGFGIGDVASTMRSMGNASSNQNGGGHQAVAYGAGVRRLTPRECERLQGFPDDYTAIEVKGKPAADGPRYKALGNSMAIPPMRWIGERIQQVDDLLAHAAPITACASVYGLCE
ncbi:DNA (cytosine-5-)-methyltransferase [Ralstonia syzygii]|uniref:DNA (cytosine-5-)-methyltransferase n=1 Tax=Ralstonia syzygii TaxID=28097 RepID=UPI0018D11E05|nr:DNA (cytosine-5-)-methyltransferase [Ralstonia syzygii]